MIGIVKLALRRPYTFIVMALLILIFGVASALRTPTDIFPNINIPVVSVVFSYTGLPPDDMAGRIVTFYERALTTSVNDIEHIESQSIPNYGIINEGREEISCTRGPISPEDQHSKERCLECEGCKALIGQ